MRTLPLLCCLLFLMPSLALADEVYLKGAGTISGRITEQTEASVTVDVGGGTMSVPMSRVDRIVKGRSPLDDYDERAQQLAPDDIDGWRKLGRWADKQGLPAQSREAYGTVLKTAPDDAEAREALGFVRLNGQWMTQDEAYRAQGYVKFDGEWMTAQEAQALQASAAAEKAHWDAERTAIDADDARRDAEERAQEEADSTWQDPVYWGGWGYGVNYWPYGTTVAPIVPGHRPGGDRPAQPPATRPGRTPR